MSPQYKVLDSPPSPESRSSLKRDYSDSTSVSPSSSPDRELYAYPSPVTPPDSDSSPPKPHSPSSPGTDFDEDAVNVRKSIVINAEDDLDKCAVDGRVKDKIKKYEQVKFMKVIIFLIKNLNMNIGLLTKRTLLIGWIHNFIVG